MTKIFALKNRSVIRISGPDSADFLQGLITNDINKASENQFIYALMLIPQGRLLYDFFITKEKDSFLIDCPSTRLDEIVKKFTMYKLRADVEIEVTDLQVFASLSQTENFKLDPRNKEMGYRYISKNLDVTEDITEYEQKRISLLIPDADLDFIYEKSFPLEYGSNELNAIDYSKGCYVGQEVTARTHNKGTVRKKLYKLEFENTSPAKETEILAGDKKIGIVLGTNGLTGLGLIRIENYETALAENLEFTAGNVKLTIK